MLIKDLRTLSPRARYALANAKIETLEQALSYPDHVLLGLDGLGKPSLEKMKLLAAGKVPAVKPSTSLYDPPPPSQPKVLVGQREGQREGQGKPPRQAEPPAPLGSPNNPVLGKGTPYPVWPAPELTDWDVANHIAQSLLELQVKHNGKAHNGAVKDAWDRAEEYIDRRRQAKKFVFSNQPLDIFKNRNGLAPRPVPSVNPPVLPPVPIQVQEQQLRGMHPALRPTPLGAPLYSPPPASDDGNDTEPSFWGEEDVIDGDE